MASVSDHLEALRGALADDLGVPDEVWCFPQEQFSRKPPLEYIEVGAWNRDSDAADVGPWTMFVTLGMSEPPQALSGIQAATELSISVPVPVTPEATQRVSFWLATLAFHPFVSRKPYRELDLLPLGDGVRLVPELAGFDAITLVGGPIGPYAKDDVTVSILTLLPISRDLADVRRGSGIDAFRSAIDDHFAKRQRA